MKKYTKELNLKEKNKFVKTYFKNSSENVKNVLGNNFKDTINKIPASKIKNGETRIQAWKRIIKMSSKYVDIFNRGDFWTNEEKVDYFAREYIFYKGSELKVAEKHGYLDKRNPNISKFSQRYDIGKEIEKETFLRRTSRFRAIHGKQKIEITENHKVKKVSLNTIFTRYKKGMISKDNLEEIINKFKLSPEYQDVISSGEYNGRNYESNGTIEIDFTRNI